MASYVWRKFMSSSTEERRKEVADNNQQVLE